MLFYKKKRERNKNDNDCLKIKNEINTKMIDVKTNKNENRKESLHKNSAGSHPISSSNRIIGSQEPHAME